MVTAISIGDVKFRIDNYSLVCSTEGSIYEFENLETVIGSIANSGSTELDIRLSFKLGCLSFRCLIDGREVYCPVLVLPVLYKGYSLKTNFRSRIRSFLNRLLCPDTETAKIFSDFIEHFYFMSLNIGSNYLPDSLNRICERMRNEMISENDKYDVAYNSIYKNIINILNSKIDELQSLVDLHNELNEIANSNKYAGSEFFKFIEILYNFVSFLWIICYAFTSYIFNNHLGYLMLFSKSKDCLKYIYSEKLSDIPSMFEIDDDRLYVLLDKVNKFNKRIKRKNDIIKLRNEIFHCKRGPSLRVDSFVPRIGGLEEHLLMYEEIFSDIVDLLGILLKHLETTMELDEYDDFWSVKDILSQISKFKPIYLYNLFRWFYDIYCNLYCLDILSGCYL